MTGAVPRKPGPSAAAALVLAGLAAAGCSTAAETVFPLLAGKGAAAAPASAPPGSAESRPPLVVIRLSGGDVASGKLVRREIGRALERDPDLRLDLVAVAPSGQDFPPELTARAERLLGTLAGIGLASERVRIRAMTGGAVTVGEIRLHVR